MNIDSLIPGKEDLIVDFMGKDWLEDNIVRLVMSSDVIDGVNSMHPTLVEIVTLGLERRSKHKGLFY